MVFEYIKKLIESFKHKRQMKKEMARLKEKDPFIYK